MIQVLITVLIIYFFGLGSIIMTVLVIRAILAYLRAARKEKQQQDDTPSRSL